MIDYKGIKLEVKHQHGKARMVFIVPTDKALRNTQQSLWVPAKHFDKEGNLYEFENIDYVLRKRQFMLVYAGYHKPIQGIMSGAYIKELIEKEVNNNGSR